MSVSSAVCLAFIEHRSRVCWRSFILLFVSPSAFRMSVTWLKTQTTVWPQWTPSARVVTRVRIRPAIQSAQGYVWFVAVITCRRRKAQTARTWFTTWNAHAITDALRGGSSVPTWFGSQFKAIQQERTARFSVVSVSSSICSG